MDSEIFERLFLRLRFKQVLRFMFLSIAHRDFLFSQGLRLKSHFSAVNIQQNHPFKTHISFVIAFVLSLALFSSDARAINTIIEAEQRNGYGRIIFNFETLPEYSHTVTGSILILKFGDTVETIVDKIPELLKDYVDVARIDPDGKAVRVAFNSIYKVNVMEAGRQLYVDILPTNWVGAPPPLPAHVLKELGRLAAEARARAEEEARQIAESKKNYRMRVRVARNKTFSRITFEWNKFVTVKMTRDGPRVLIRFNRRANVRLNRVRANPPPYLRKISAADVPEGMTIEMVINPEANVRGFREGNSYIVDLSGPESDLQLSADNFEKKIRSGLANTDDAQQDNTNAPEEIKIAQDETVNEQEEALEDGRTVKILEVPFAVTQLDFDPKKLDSFEFGDLDGVNNESSREFSVLDGWGGVATPQEQAAQLRLRRQAEDKAKKEQEKQAEKAQQAQTSEQKNEETEDGAIEPSNIVTASTSKLQDTVRLTFPFQKPVASAVFRRARTLWLAFDTDQEMDLSSIKEAAGDMVKSVERADIPGLRLIKIRLEKPWLVYANRDEGNWQVIIGDMITGEAQPLHLKRELRSDQRSVVVIDYEKPGRVHWIKDNQIGDDIAIVTGFGPTRAIIKPQTLVEFDALPTAHGIAIRPKSDDVLVRLRVNEVMISRKRGLTVSAGGAAQYVAGQKALDKQSRGRLGFIDFRNWQQGGKGRFADRAGELERAIAAADEKDKNKLRLELARLYVSHELAPETLGIVRQIVNSDKGAKADPALNILRGASNTILRRHREAREDLELHALAFDDDAALWRGLLATNEKKWAEALKEFSQGMGEIESYPFHLQAKFRLAEAEAALAQKQMKRAADTLDALPGVVLPPTLEMRADLLRGRYLQMIGRTQEALDNYIRVANGDVNESSVAAKYHKIKLQLRLKQIGPDEAIKAFESLSVVWRGDDIELRTLKQLARLYVHRKKYRPAFEIMKNTVIAFPDDKNALRIQDEMKKVFTDLFLYGKGDNLPTITALGLYYDYRELTPIGRLGDELIRRLATRLTKVDLLDQASELLDYQVKNRLNGVARAQVASRLAMIQLMNRKPAIALRTIRDTRQPDLPRDLKRRRDLLEARALGEIGRVEGAIDVLDRLEGNDALRLRADAFWTAQKWQQAGEQLEKLLGKRWQDPSPLSDTERFDVLRSAVSYALANDQFALDRLRRKFYDTMIKSVDAETFVLVTRSITNRGDDFETLAKEIASVDTLDAFMKEFRARYDRNDTQQPPAQTSAADGNARPLG